MNQNNLVSILIPVYNRDKFIEETINSALSQTYQNIEIIIVDNNSTDNTWRIIKKYTKKDNRIKAFKNDTNIGPVRNWKKCTDKADGEFGKILWSDDLIAPEFIEKTFGDVYEIELKTKITRPLTHHYFHEGYTRALYLSNGDIGIVTILHQSMHQIERLKDDFGL